MKIAFPPNIRIRRIRPRLMGLRHEPFTNIDGETFAKPTLNGFWRVEMEFVCACVAELFALSSFLTAMRGHAACAIPMTTRFLPLDDAGRPLNGFGIAPEYTSDHEGWAAEPFDGFRLIAGAGHRDSYIDVQTPALSRLVPGHFITLGDRLHQVVNVNSIDEREDQLRVSIMPNVRGDYPADTVVVVDQLRLLARMESADDLDYWSVPHSEVAATFLEAF